MMISRLGHVGIAVRDLDEAVEFYVGVLGLKLSERFVYPVEGPGHAVREAAFVRCGTDHHTLSIFALKDEPAVVAGPGGYGLHHIAFELPTYERLVEAYRHLRDAGAFIQSQRSGGPGNQPRFYARDPDGNLLEFYAGIDQIGWDGRTRPFPPIEEVALEDYDPVAYEARVAMLGDA